MDITKFVVDRREAAFLIGDYSTYRDQLSRRLRIVRKKLGRATPKNAKYAAKSPVTAEEIGKNIEYALTAVLVVNWLLINSEPSISSCSLPSGHGRMPWP
jgi:hypothetical protein